MDTAQSILNQASTAATSAVQSIIGSGSSALPARQLGKNGPFVTSIGFGTMGLSAFYGKPKPDAERFAVLNKAYEIGDLFWDSADMYESSFFPNSGQANAFTGIRTAKTS